MALPSRASSAPRQRKANQRVRSARQGLYRDLVLEAAAATFAARGVEHSRMEEIAAASGLSLGTVYAVFRGKAAIVDALHERRLREVLEQSAEEARGLSDPLQRLLAGLRVYITYFLSRPDYLRMYIAEGQSWGTGSGQPGRSPRTLAWQEGITQQEQVFRRGIELGIFYPGDPNRMARTLVAMQQVRLADWLADGMRDAAETVLAELELQLRRAFCVRPIDRGDTAAPRAARKTKS